MSGMTLLSIQWVVSFLLALMAPPAIFWLFARVLTGHMVYWNLAVIGLAVFAGLPLFVLTPLFGSALTVNFLYFLMGVLSRRVQQPLPRRK